MTKTNATAKVSYIKPKAPEPSDACGKAKAQGVSDVYKASDPNAYKGLINGSPKAEALEGAVLEEMYEAASQPPRKNRGYYDRMQDFMGTLLVGDASWKPPTDTVGDVPFVPNLHKDILSRGIDTVCSMEPVVMRYAGLEKVLVDMIDVATRSMHRSNMSRMTAGEFRSLEAYRRKIVDTLRECRLQKASAERYLEDQRAKEAAGIW